MKILILGGGGREHALAWAIAQNPKCDHLFCAPGNAGIGGVADCMEIDLLDVGAVCDFCRLVGIDLVVVGPEAPLAAGVADALRRAGTPVLGPSRAVARLEASKAFAKEIARAAGVPTAASASFTDPAAARAHVAATGAPIVVKADGLAAGKGVVVAESVDEANTAIDAMFGGQLGAAGVTVLVEEFMPGEEASFFALVDGETVLPLGTAQDHKRAFDGDRGPNTGGMGAYSPAPVMTPAVVDATLATIVRPTLAELARRDTPYQGILYAGLMIEGGTPRLVEFNVRFGDPEAQVILMRLGAQFLDAALACVEGRLAEARLNWADDHALTVVMAANGYPGPYARGEEIGNLATDDPRVQVFHAGTRADGDRVLSDGGRVLGVTARGATLREARDRAYATVARIDWPGGFYRRDIGWRALGPAEPR